MRILNESRRDFLKVLGLGVTSLSWLTEKSTANTANKGKDHSGIYTAREIGNVIEKIAPLDSGVPHDQLGFVFGDPETKVRGIGCLWNVHSRSVKLAADKGLNMLICHEKLWPGPQKSDWYVGPDESQIFAKIIRKDLLEKYNMVVYRSHSNWDALANDGVQDQAVLALGIEGLEVIKSQKFFRVYQLAKPLTVQAIKTLAEKGLGFSGCRVFGNSTKIVNRFAFLIGGFGENQYHMPQAAKEMGSEVIIIGEMSEFIVISALEMEMTVIETLHSVSEIPGIRRQAHILAEKFPDLRVMYIPSGALAY